MLDIFSNLSINSLIIGAVIGLIASLFVGKAIRIAIGAVFILIIIYFTYSKIIAKPQSSSILNLSLINQSQS